ncbi:C45 family autoproteolytic acyltransferase/hydrolase [Nocardiopsis sp. NPDC050513]|uniref:C45 family autoproteolytic acyltransferase/hydolase n=1 Tax=Nocardiopsis sp. NPDC050513 TaxID=3364338 RepID=UPI003789A85B
MSVSVFTSPDGGHTARGRTLGSTWGERVRATWDRYERHFADLGLAARLVRDVGHGALDRVAAWAPRLAEEIHGIAEGAGLEPWQAGALNARSEVLAHVRPAPPGECSVSVYLPGEGLPRTVQTWDWIDGMEDGRLVWSYRPRPGHTVSTFTEFGVLAKIGVNSAGLGLHFNLLKHRADGGVDGVPVHVVARRVLEEAGSVAEAGRVIRSAPVTASVALTVVAHDGDRSEAATFEVSPAGVAVLPVRPDGFLWHTNHFLDPALAEGEALGVDDQDTYDRQAALARLADGLAGADVADRAAALAHHRGDGAALCRHPEAGDTPDARWRTLMTVGLDLERHRLAFQGGNPCTLRREEWLHH